MQNGLYLGSYCSSGLSWFSAIDNGNVSLLWHFEVEKKYFDWFLDFKKRTILHFKV